MLNNNYDILQGPFDIEIHKKAFTNYLEVIIHSDGSIHYAVPSHQEYLIRYIVKDQHITRDDLYDRVPREYYCDMLTYLCQESKCIAVWNGSYIGDPNKAQLLTLRSLKINGLYKGSLR